MTGTRAPPKVLVPVISQRVPGIIRVPDITMVTVQTKNFNRFSQEIYEEIVESLPLHQITCTCGHSGCMRKYGHYERTIWFLNEKLSLQIHRIQCTHCGRTHAVLLDIMVPYSRILLEDQIKIILADNGGEDCVPVFVANGFIDKPMAHYIRRQYRRHWKQKLLAEGISLLRDTGDIVRNCFRCYYRQFMQIRNTPNILFLPST